MTQKNTAKFISFEGTEGVGKTTAIEGVCRYLTAEGIQFVRTREPGGSKLGEHIRHILLNPDSQLDSATELLLFFSARADHLNRLILPALAANTWVICDRFLDSTVAYQGFGRFYADEAYLAKIELLATQFVSRLPDQTFWLDLPIEVGMARALARSGADRFEQESSAFFERVYQGFEYQYQRHQQRICRIDAIGARDEVLQQILASLF